MKISFNNYILISFALISLGIIFLGNETNKNNKKYVDTVRWVEHTQEVLYESEQILALNQDIETGLRGFVLTNNEAFLTPFNAAKTVASEHLATLKELTKDNLNQQKRIVELSALTQAKIVFSDEVIASTKKNGFEAGKKLVASGQGMKYMSAIKNVLDSLQKEESSLLKIRRQENDKSNAAFNRSYVFQLIAIVVAIIILAGLLVYNLKARKKAQIQLAEKEQLLQSIIDNTSSAIYVKDLNGRFVLVNKAYANLLNSSMESLRGKTVFDVYPYDVATELREKELKVLEDKQAVESEDDVVFDGELQHFLSVRYPLYHKDGSISVVCGISTNITNIKRQSNLIQDLYDNAPCGYYSVDEEGKFINVNKTTLSWLGYGKEELIGKSLKDVLAEEYAGEFEDIFSEFKATGKLVDKEFSYTRKDNSQFPVLLNASSEKDEQGKFKYSRSTIFDITERKQLQDELKLVNKELESFTYSISHDLRAPLRIMNGYAGIIAEEYAAVLDEDGVRMVRNIIANAQKMGQLIDDLLNFSRLGRKELDVHSVDMNIVVKQLIEEQLTGDAVGKYTVKIGDLGRCTCDTSLVKQVWQNLISNAIKYSSRVAKPVIEINSTVRNGQQAYSIKDNGVGFDMKYYDKLFGVFQRLHKVSEFDGTGVGLALVQRIVIKHGGRIWAEAHVNEGATFYFTLCAQKNK